MKKLTKTIALIALASLLILTLSSCGSAQDTTTVSSQPVVADVFSAQSEPEALPTVESHAVQAEPEILPDAGNDSFQSEPEAAPAAESTSGRQDGERFQDVIMLEGMEETVSYEHVKNDTIGIELDYDYENFERRSGSASECFISRYDNADDPQIYLEIFYSSESADSAASSIANSLSNDYDVIKESRALKNAGPCTCLDASATKDGQTPDKLQTVYVIPLNNGCVVATAHYTFESADGFGHRFNEIMNTLTVMPGR